jgi:hypothetical protein
MIIAGFFTIDDLGMSEKAFDNIPTNGARTAESPQSRSQLSRTVIRETIIMAGNCSSSLRQ